MIITKTPYRISFFGGGSDYPAWYNQNQGKVISTTIDKSVYITCRFLPKFFKKHNYRISYSKTEEVKSINQINHKVFREILKYIKFKQGLEIHYDGELPARSGMGSSSAVVVGLIKALYALKKKNINKKQLAEKSIYFEQKVLEEIVGVQDQIAGSYGGFNVININKKSFIVKPLKKRKEFLKKLQDNLLLVYSGMNRDAQKIAKTYALNLNKKFKSNISQLIEITDEAEKILLNGTPDEFGKLLNESWKLKKGLSNIVTNNKIDGIYDYFLNNGALGGKILGAGGGGFLLFYMKNNKKKLISKNKDLVTIPFKFSNYGSTIISN